MIEFTDVVKSYTEGNRALNGVSMQIEDGEFVFLVGPSGSGKSTIMKLITGELKPTSGTVHVNGYNLERIRKREIPFMRRTLGVVFQDFRLIPNMTVYDNVAFAMRVIGAKEKEIKERVPYVLDLVGLENKSHRHPGEISGGEQQRLAIARALVNNPSTIIADEPTGNLDPERSFEIMTLLRMINDLGTTVMVVTHERDLVERFDKRVIAINEGVVVSDGMDGYYRYENQLYWLSDQGGHPEHLYPRPDVLCLRVCHGGLSDHRGFLLHSDVQREHHGGGSEPDQ